VGDWARSSLDRHATRIGAAYVASAEAIDSGEGRLSGAAVRAG
jgi:hypothetical protein